MKKLIPLIFLLGLGKAYAQRPFAYDDTKITITDTGQTVQAEILPSKSDPKILNDRYYFWYIPNAIHSTQGGFNGQLLNGNYAAYYPDKNLKEQGDYKKGLKDGVWKTWNRKGDLTSVVNWNNGVVAPQSGGSVLSKLPFGKKKSNAAPATTTSQAPVATTAQAPPPATTAAAVTAQVPPASPPATTPGQTPPPPTQAPATTPVPDTNQ